MSTVKPNKVKTTQTTMPTEIPKIVFKVFFVWSKLNFWQSAKHQDQDLAAQQNAMRKS
jgi:hypothetical protein